MIARVTHRLVHVRVNFVVCAFLFWIAQLVAWVCMMAYVQFFNPRLGQNVLYVTQISHWALVITSGTAATATWGVLASRSNARRLEGIHRDVDPENDSPLRAVPE